MTYQNDRKTPLFLSVGVLAGIKESIFEKTSHFFLKKLAEILLDLHSAKLGDNVVPSYFKYKMCGTALYTKT